MSREKGNHWEQIAAKYLQKKGLKLCGQNFQTRLGEIDLIVSNRQDLVFVEVRYRKNRQFGSAAESVSYSKQQKLAKTAAAFLQQHPQFDQHHCRFDVLAIEGDEYNYQLEWITHAFENPMAW